MRFEYKYLIDDHIYNLLKNELSIVLDSDKNHINNEGYVVYSHYLDDINNKDYYNSLIGFKKRKKFRVRYYNDNFDYIKLEKKIKIDDKVKKENIKINKKEYKSILNQNYNFIKNEKAKSELNSRDYKAKLLIKYDRLAYTLPFNDIRITLDSNLRYKNNYLNKNKIFRNVDKEYKRILEVKFNNFLPNHVKMILEKYNLNRLSISKYVISRQSLRNSR
ncbi:MAG: VTC domain-containing protein [Bacillota bacterium]